MISTDLVTTHTVIRVGIAFLCAVNILTSPSAHVAGNEKHTLYENLQLTASSHPSTDQARRCLTLEIARCADSIPHKRVGKSRAY